MQRIEAGNGARADPGRCPPNPRRLLNQRPGRNRQPATRPCLGTGQGEAEGVSKACAPQRGRSAQPPRPGRTWASSGSRSLTPSRSFRSRALPKRRFSPHLAPGRAEPVRWPSGALCPRGVPGLRQTRSRARRAGRQAPRSARSGCRDWERRRARARSGEDQEEEQEQGAVC